MWGGRLLFFFSTSPLTNKLLKKASMPNSWSNIKMQQFPLFIYFLSLPSQLFTYDLSFVEIGTILFSLWFMILLLFYLTYSRLYEKKKLWNLYLLYKITRLSVHLPKEFYAFCIFFGWSHDIVHGSVNLWKTCEQRSAY